MSPVLRIHTLKLAIIFMACLQVSPRTVAAREGGGVTGGGDPCERRITEIKLDFKSWIQQGGHGGLVLPTGMSGKAYAASMTDAIDTAKVRCVKPGDVGHPVHVVGRPKVCRFDKSADGAQAVVTCDYTTFMDPKSTDETEQYRLVHHELAGLANVEVPDEGDSDYRVSNQITGFLQTVVVKRLSIRDPNARFKEETYCVAFNKEAPYGTWKYARFASCTDGTRQWLIDRPLSPWGYNFKGIWDFEGVRAYFANLMHEQGYEWVATIDPKVKYEVYRKRRAGATARPRQVCIHGTWGSLDCTEGTILFSEPGRNQEITERMVGQGFVYMGEFPDIIGRTIFQVKSVRVYFR